MQWKSSNGFAPFDLDLLKFIQSKYFLHYYNIVANIPNNFYDEDNCSE